MRRVRAGSAALLLAGCVTQGNYTSATQPRYEGSPPPHVAARVPSDTLRIASFNIEFSLRTDSALKVIQENRELREADVLLLQEMDMPSARYIARTLGMWFVYYPASRHFVHNRDFGNAVLSRWPIVEDAKLILPHRARVHRSQRTATAATIRIDTMLVRVYSAHLGTVANITTAQRRAQLEMILKDAARYGRVIIGGDMNDASIGEVAREHGYEWPTEQGPRTAVVGRLDHIFFKGFLSPSDSASGTVLAVRESSDHRPIWAVALIRR